MTIFALVCLCVGFRAAAAVCLRACRRIFLAPQRADRICFGSQRFEFELELQLELELAHCCEQMHWLPSLLICVPAPIRVRTRKCFESHSISSRSNPISNRCQQHARAGDSFRPPNESLLLLLLLLCAACHSLALFVSAFSVRQAAKLIQLSLFICLSVCLSVAYIFRCASLLAPLARPLRLLVCFVCSD